jgi:hypothetical protein
MRYIDQDTVDQCREALRMGGNPDEIAMKLGLSAEELGRLVEVRPKSSQRVDIPRFERSVDMA